MNLDPGQKRRGAAAPLLFLEDGEVFVDGFARGVGEGAGVGVDDGSDLDGTEVFEGGGGEFVLFVEIGGDDEETVIAKHMWADDVVLPSHLVKPRVEISEHKLGTVRR